MYINTAEESCL